MGHKDDKREKLPQDRHGITRKVNACGLEFYLTINFYAKSGLPAEMFIRIAKEGSTIAGFFECFAITVSIAWQYGVPWEVLFDKYVNQIFEPRDDINSSLIHAIGMEVTSIIKLWQEIQNGPNKI
ncbi:MAG: hypothetical protein KAS32_10140 [Candidatus Peribacteraceae bacterium]|nr:hypothetical protein [Candidatus Peribacteraceae bacterium]